MFKDITVLIAEDHHGTASAMRRVVEGMSFRAISVSEVYQAINLHTKTHILLADVQLVNGQCLPLLEAWARNNQGPVCVMSDKPISAEDENMFYACGAWHVAVKPLEKEKLHRIMMLYGTAVLERTQLTRLAYQVGNLWRWVAVLSLVVAAMIGPQVIPWILKLFV